MELHNLTDTDNLNVVAFEKETMDKLGLIPEIAPRYRATYFSHIIGGYALLGITAIYGQKFLTRMLLKRLKNMECSIKIPQTLSVKIF